MSLFKEPLTQLINNYLWVKCNPNFSVEKSILRLAIFEILFEDLPKAVVINEAIELSKKLASDGAPKFVNGLLDKVVKA